MHQVNIDYAKSHLDELCNQAKKITEGVGIVHQNQVYVLISQEEWESVMETAMLIQIPDLLQQVATAREEYSASDTFSMEQIFG